MQSQREIIYHFKVDTSCLLVQNFNDATNLSQKILLDLNLNVFGGQVQYELTVTPSERGSFTIVMEVTVFAAALVTLLGSDLSKVIFRHFSGKHFEEHVVHLLRRFDSPSVDSEKVDEVSDEYITEKIERIVGQERQSKQSEIIIDTISSVHKAILTKGADELNGCGITGENFSSSFHARDKFYKGCLGNKEIQGLGFERKEEFPISQQAFAEFILPRSSYESSQKNYSEDKWILETVAVQVNSPNWKMKGRKWQATWRQKKITFNVVDDVFWHLVHQDKIKVTTSDVMRVQLGYKYSQSNRANDFRVFRVLSYNGNKVSEPMTEEEIARKLDRTVEVLREDSRLL